MASQVRRVEADVHIKASPEQFHEIFCGKLPHLPNICSDTIKSIDVHEGEWGAEGVVLIWNYMHDGKACVAKQVAENIDTQNNKVTFRVLEGDLLKDYKTFKFLLQVTPEKNGSVVHWTLEYEKLKDNTPDPHTLMQSVVEVTKGVGTHLIAAN